MCNGAKIIFQRKSWRKIKHTVSYAEDSLLDTIETDCYVVTSQQGERRPAGISGLGHQHLNADLAVLSGSLDQGCTYLKSYRIEPNRERVVIDIFTSSSLGTAVTFLCGIPDVPDSNLGWNPD
jgi:hypothetical protein